MCVAHLPFGLVLLILLLYIHPALLIQRLRVLPSLTDIIAIRKSIIRCWTSCGKIIAGICTNAICRSARHYHMHAGSQTAPWYTHACSQAVVVSGSNNSLPTWKPLAHTIGFHGRSKRSGFGWTSFSVCF